MKTFVIAEAGSCHDGSLAKAQDLVRLAATIGADACKFQWVSSAERLCERRNAPEYLAAYKLIEFPRDWFADLKSRCEDHGIEFMCTAYLPEDVPVVARYVKRFKIASFEARDQVLRDIHRAFGKQIVFSTGMTEDGDFAFASRAWPPLRRGDAILHCVSAYPTPDDEINLRAIRGLRFGWPCEIVPGLSDHTRHPWTGALAVAVGAQMVEFHIRLSETDWLNADFAVARSHNMAYEYVRNIRTAEKMLGDGVKRVMPSEAQMLKYRVAP